MTSPAQLTLMEGIAGWRDESPRAQRLREQAVQRRRDLEAQLGGIRAEIQNEKEILAAIVKAQETALAEIAALGKQKPMVIDELADELHHLLNPEPTDNPHNIAARLGYTDLENLTYRLRRNGLHTVAEQLKKPLKKPPAPYPAHATQRARRARKPAATD